MFPASNAKPQIPFVGQALWLSTIPLQVHCTVSRCIHHAQQHRTSLCCAPSLPKRSSQERLHQDGRIRIICGSELRHLARTPPQSPSYCACKPQALPMAHSARRAHIMEADATGSRPLEPYLNLCILTQVLLLHEVQLRHSHWGFLERIHEHQCFGHQVEAEAIPAAPPLI